MFVGNRDSLSLINIQLVFHSSQLLFKFVNVCHPHCVQQGNVLGTWNQKQHLSTVVWEYSNKCTAWTHQIKIRFTLHPLMLHPWTQEQGTGTRAPKEPGDTPRLFRILQKQKSQKLCLSSLEKRRCNKLEDGDSIITQLYWHLGLRQNFVL